jgi:curved DNA-binding protein CbpA
MENCKIAHVDTSSLVNALVIGEKAMSPLHKAYSILGLEPGSSLEAVEARYQRLLTVWHPDRFPTVEGKREAEQELDKINYANDLLHDHFESDKHDGDACECSPDTIATHGEADDEEEEHYRSAKKRTGIKKRKRKSLDMDEVRDRRFSMRLQGGGNTRTDGDDEKPRGRINEKVLNWILAAVAAIIVFVGWLSTMGPASAPDQAQKTAPPQMLQSTQGQTQPGNPLQQLLRSSEEQTQQPSQEQSQQTTQEQPQESQQ